MMEIHLNLVKEFMIETPLDPEAHFQLKHWLERLIPEVEELMKVCNSKSDQ